MCLTLCKFLASPMLTLQTKNEAFRMRTRRRELSRWRRQNIFRIKGSLAFHDSIAGPLVQARDQLELVLYLLLSISGYQLHRCVNLRRTKALCYQ